MNIDFVVTWLDSSDPKWQEEYCRYKGITSNGDQSFARFRDWDLFKYWFRSIEKYAPWVHKVFLVTNGKFPDWINVNHPKLVLVKHSDYIPQVYLPTFNSHTIELNMNNIEGLSEHFVYFNDDCYLNNDVTPDYYFMKGLPCDENVESVYNVPTYNNVNRFAIEIIKYTNIGVLNGHFKRNETIKGHIGKWFGSHLSMRDKMMSIIITLDPHHRFIGFRTRHFEQPFLKSVLDEAWHKEKEMLSLSCTRFREDVNLSPYFFRYWQFATNKFYPVKQRHNRKYTLLPDNLPEIKNALNNPKVWSLCLNDSAKCRDDDKMFKPSLIKAFEEKFPKKSSFEI